MTTIDPNAFYRVYTENGDLLSYAAKVDADGEFFQAGSCTGPVTGYVEEVKVGDTFDHWREGTLTVEKINRVTMKVRRPNGETFSFPIG